MLVENVKIITSMEASSARVNSSKIRTSKAAKVEGEEKMLKKRMEGEEGPPMVFWL